MTKEKRFKRMVRDVAKRTGRSYAATRARLDKRRANATPSDVQSPYELMKTLAVEIDLAAEELRAEEGGLPTWVSYQQRPGARSSLVPRRARELRDRLESMGDRDLFAVLAIIICGKMNDMAFEEVINDARGCVDAKGIDFGIDYAFKKLPATGEYFRCGLVLFERAGVTPETCWEAGFGPANSAAGGGKSLPRRVVERPW